MHRFGNQVLSVAVAAAGAEPVSLRAGGDELLWQAGPAWPRHAPVLFPIVGRLADDTLRRDGRAYRMTQHGFARDRRFEWVERSEAGCRLRLVDDAETRAVFPYGFRLEVGYAVEGGTLSVEYGVGNPGDEMLAFSIGAHPAFRWPLADGVDRRAHRLVFERDEPAPIRRVSGGLLRADAEASPVRGRVLALDEALFADDAVILDRVASGWVRYEAEGVSRALTVGWHGMAELGIWSKPGAGFLCIEPWHGMASPVGFEGEFKDKPGLMRLAPGEEARLGWSVTVSGLSMPA